jgi:rhodanese-related sulfurtransferase
MAAGSMQRARGSDSWENVTETGSDTQVHGETIMTTQKGSPAQTVHQVPERKQTTVGLYVTSEEAYEMWRGNPERVHIIDVRTPEEYVFVGHAEMARNIPLLFVKHEWNADIKEFVMEPNPGFIPRVKSLFAPTDTLLVMCRSGDRSAMAVNALAKAGFVNVYNIIDGMEGDRVDDPGCVYHGKRMRNGWKNCSAPWTYEVNPEQTCMPSVKRPEKLG